jgi:hypothetical protein
MMVIRQLGFCGHGLKDKSIWVFMREIPAHIDVLSFLGGKIPPGPPFGKGRCEKIPEASLTPPPLPSPIKGEGNYLMISNH